MKRKLDRILERPITSIILGIVLVLFMVVAVACNQPIEEEVVEPIQHQQKTYRVLPLVVIGDNAPQTETDAETEIETEAVTAVETEEGKRMMITAFAYCPCIRCCNKEDGITATGTKATPGRTIAVDPSVIPYGSMVIINGHAYVAEDCGGSIKGNTIDVFHATHEEALQWGVKYVDAVVYPAEEVTK